MSLKRILQASKLQQTDRIPIWLMRQAGRYQKSYREIRKKYSIFDICKIPDICAQVTMLPIKQFPNLDAAIIFSDILILVEAMGINVAFIAGEGPVIENPISSSNQIEKLKKIRPEENLHFVLKAINDIRKELPEDKSLIGFCGAPFTLSSYLIEGGSSNKYLKTKEFMYKCEKDWHLLMEKLSIAIADHLIAQSNSGADIVQLFDSWVGALSPQDYKRYIFKHNNYIFDRLKSQNIPSIHFSTGTTSYLDLIKEAGGDVISVDWRIKIDQARRKIGENRAIQGNLDPSALFASQSVIKEHVDDILSRVDNKKGFIFNLGHGVLPNTPEENVEFLINYVHSK